jgi:hypothetical protein
MDIEEGICDMPEIGFAFNLFIVFCGSFIVGMAGLVFWIVALNPEIIHHMRHWWRKQQRGGHGSQERQRDARDGA